MRLSCEADGGRRRSYNSAIRLLSVPVVSALVAFAVCLPASAAFAKGGGKKKIIYYGWGLPDTQYVRDHWREMEEMPLDGTGILVAIDRKKWQEGARGENNQLGRQVMGRRQFRSEEFQQAAADLKAAHWRSFTDNFLPIALSSSVSAEGLNWFDDARWTIVENNFRVVAMLAAKGGAKGLILDPEHYGYSLFSYQFQRSQVDRPFDAYSEMARERGREVMRSISLELPQAALLSFYGHSLLWQELRRRQNIADAQYSLLTDFYDGLLEVMGPRARLYDGYEFSYGFKERRQFLEGYGRIHGSAVSLSSVPNRYRKNVRAAFGLWLDREQRFAYFSPEEFRQALTYALEVSDRYVWIYGQSFRLFPVSKIPSSFIDSIAAARLAAN